MNGLFGIGRLFSNRTTKVSNTDADSENRPPSETSFWSSMFTIPVILPKLPSFFFSVPLFDISRWREPMMSLTVPNTDLLMALGLHYTGKTYRLAPKGTVPENCGRKFVQELESLANMRPDNWRSADGGRKAEYVVCGSAYNGDWESVDAKSMKMLIKFEGTGTHWVECRQYSEKEIRNGEHPAIVEWLWREHLLSKVRDNMRSQCARNGQNFHIIYPDVFPFRADRQAGCRYSDDRATWKRTLLRVKESEINDYLRQIGLPPVIIEDWTGLPMDALMAYIYTAYIWPSRKVQRALGKCADPSLAKSCDASCSCNGGDGEGCKCAAITNARLEGPVECGEECGCTVDTCKSRVLQRGRKHPLLIIRHPKIGWTMRALEVMEGDELAEEFTGEVLSAYENQKMEEPWTYSIGMGKITSRRGKRKYVHRAVTNNAQRKGNAARFFSHHCTPNMRMENRLVERIDGGYHRFAFFLNRRVEIGDELTFIYEENEFIKNEGKVGNARKVWSLLIPKCECDSADCRILPWTPRDFEIQRKRKMEKKTRKKMQTSEDGKRSFVAVPDEDSMSEGGETESGDEHERDERRAKRKVPRRTSSQPRPSRT